jgi:AcrR family transcriptional regulator
MSQPLPSRRSADPSTRERMLDVALESFADLGYDGASTRAIAHRAGVNQGMIPYYFGSKEALWREAVDRAFGELRAEIDPLLAEGGRGRGRAETLIRVLVHFIARNPSFARLMSAEGKRESARMRWIVDRHVRPLFEATRDAGLGVVAGTRLAKRVDPAHVYYILVGAVTQLFHQGPECRRLTGLDPTDPAVADAHADALVQLFAPDPPKRSPR